jgi:hypothetical protein
MVSLAWLARVEKACWTVKAPNGQIESVWGTLRRDISQDDVHSREDKAISS